MLLWLLLSSTLVPVILSTATNRSFVIDYDNNTFLKDGQPFRYVSGSLHYFRVHPSDWPDRLYKMRYAGLNVVQTYVEWSSHEPEPGQYQFAGGLDIAGFLEEAARQDLLVVLRVGPYICSERDMGGFPYWLLRLHPTVRLRTSDADFVRHLDSWLLVGLFPRIRPYLYENGGPVIMLQVENEYGNFYACDYSYTEHLRRVFRLGLGHRPLLFTTDNGSPHALKCGKIPQVYATVDFGPDADPLYEFGSQRLFEPQGPLVNSEFYSGWMDHWGQPHHKTGAEALSSALDTSLAMGASVNVYMFHGGTNFGFSAGSNKGAQFLTCPTSYDYDAPLSEAGDMTTKYEAIRRVVGKYLPLPNITAPRNSSKGLYGPVTVELVGHHLTLVTEHLLESVQDEFPLTFEQLHVSSGIVGYQTTITFQTADPSILRVWSLHDRAQVYVNGVLKGVVSRRVGHEAVPLRTRVGDVLVLLVESLGRISVGIQINDFKGITTNVTLDSKILKFWTMVPLPLENYDRLTSAVQKLRLHRLMNRVCCEGTQHLSLCTYTANTRGFCQLSQSSSGLYDGVLTIPLHEEPKDTFLRLDGWTKGIAWMNGFMLGRYWPVMGPQATLYVPHGVLKRGPNSLMLLELEGVDCGGHHGGHSGGGGGVWVYANGVLTFEEYHRPNCQVAFVDKPDIDTAVPTN